MHRSSSSSSSNARVPDEFFVNLSQAAMALPLLKAAAASDDLAEYDDPITTETPKKEIAFHLHKSTGERAIHLIPLVLLLCALTLWIFSRRAPNI